MRVWDDCPEFVEGVVQVVHPAAFAGVDVQTDGFALTVLRFAAGILGVLE